MLFCVDVFRPSYLLRRKHDGPHTDVLGASRSLEGKEIWAITSFHPTVARVGLWTWI